MLSLITPYHQLPFVGAHTLKHFGSVNEGEKGKNLNLF